MYSREQDELVDTFGTTGYTHKNVFVLYDRSTESIWYPYDEEYMTAVSGPRKGETIPIQQELPVMPLGQWLEKHPDSLILAPPENEHLFVALPE